MRFPYASVALLCSYNTVATARNSHHMKGSHNWGPLSTYTENAEDAFGVKDVGLPDGCRVESVSLLQRHAQRFPDGNFGESFVEKVNNFTTANAGSENFVGPLEFLNSIAYIIDGSGDLTGIGAATEFTAGALFWGRYGRVLFNATAGQLSYNPAFRDNGMAQSKISLRTTGMSRIENSQINWALGFFGPSFNATPNPVPTNWTYPTQVVVIPEDSAQWNNTLSATIDCANSNSDSNGNIADQYVSAYGPVYLTGAVERLQKYAPVGFNFSMSDVWTLQALCPFEVAYIGMSSYCELFTEDEWAGFEQYMNLLYWYSYSYGNPTGRAQGIGYLQELIARLQHVYIPSHNSSINATLDSNASTFPLGQKVYADFTHDNVIISVLTAMSLDYFNEKPSDSRFPPNAYEHFQTSKMTPFGGHLVTETIGCGSADPKPVRHNRVPYKSGQYGYDPSTAKHKFVRMRLNNGILPLDSIRGGACAGRHDGLCELSAFLKSQQDSYYLSNYDYACFGNYTIPNSTVGINYDGTIFETGK